MAEAIQKLGSREVSANEILTKIEKGEPVNYDHYRIIDDIDIRKLSWLNEERPIITSQIIITNSRIEGKLNFKNAILEQQALFNNTYFHKYTCFLGVQFKGGVTFEGAIFIDSVVFNEAQLLGNCSFINTRFLVGSVFTKTQFHCDANFLQTLFAFDAIFIETRFYKEAHFWSAQFKKSAIFDNAIFSGSAYFWKGAYFSEFAQFWETQFNGDVLTFRNAVFDKPFAQEGACRRAKNVLEKNGNREEAGYHFYREMEAKRLQKPWYIRYTEFIFIQLIFGYGVHPFWLIYWWLLIVCIFAFVYSVGNGINGATQWYDYIWFSITTAIIPGRGSYQPISEFQVIAGIEAILGTFLWAAFIATFAKKYMK